jgi:protein-tyrosine phosphatase
VIDLHCHILPGIDDGAPDLAESLAMARQAFDDGIETVCATPHIRHDHDVRIEELPSRVEQLNAALAGHRIAVRIVGGGEVAETAVAGLDDDELRRVAFGGRWILLEPAPGPLGDSLPAAVDELGERGYRCVIAHPERHPGSDMAQRLAALIDRGALVQMTAALLVEGPAAPTMLELAGRGLVHVLGSDSHSSRIGRPVALSAGLERLWEVEALRPHADWIAREAPAAILAGRAVEPPYPARA